MHTNRQLLTHVIGVSMSWLVVVVVWVEVGVELCPEVGGSKRTIARLSEAVVAKDQGLNDFWLPLPDATLRQTLQLSQRIQCSNLMLHGFTQQTS